MIKWDSNSLDPIGLEEIGLACEKSNERGKIYFSTDSVMYKSSSLVKGGWKILEYILIVMVLIGSCIYLTKSRY